MNKSGPAEEWRRRYRHARDTVKFWRRQIRRTFRDPRLALGMLKFRRSVRRREWPKLRDALPALGQRALTARDPQLMSELRLAAEQLGLYERASEWEHETAILRDQIEPSEWKGESLGDSTLVVNFMETVKQGAAAGLRLTGYVAAAASRARRTILVVERRLVPIYQRSFPEAEVIAGPSGIKPLDGEHLVTANMRVLRTVLGSDEPTIRRLHMPLLADPENTRRFRASYKNGEDVPLVGISWWSSHHGKDLPPLEAWAGMMRGTPARFVNVQYGDVTSDLDILRQMSGRELIDDRSVNQLEDMDAFAAQLASLDAVVTISCTGAHLAASLDVPVVLVRDDWFRREWPVLSEATPWCPQMVVIGKNGADWESQFALIEARLHAMITTGPSVRRITPRRPDKPVIH